MNLVGLIQRQYRDWTFYFDLTLVQNLEMVEITVSIPSAQRNKHLIDIHICIPYQTTTIAPI